MRPAQEYGVQQVGAGVLMAAQGRVPWAGRWWAALWVGALVTLASCGGGVGSGGTGSPVAQASGTVTGFGSIIVDGLAHDDSTARVLDEVGPGIFQSAVARLGQFVDLDLEEGFEAGAASRASRIELAPAVVGPVTAVRAAGFDAMGLEVRINADPQAGPVTVFEGLGGVADLADGDAVRVFGVWRRGAAESRYTLTATRVEKPSALSDQWRVAGVAQGAGATAGRFMLGSLSVDHGSARWLPAGAPLPRDGERVTVWASQLPVNGVLVANAVRLVAMGDDEPKPLLLGGVVSRLDAAARRFDLGGMSVRYEASAVLPRGQASALVEGAYVQVAGLLNAEGVLEADRVRLRSRVDPEFVEVRLRGPLEQVAGLSSLLVRGVRVDASSARLRCEGVALQPGVPVRVEGSVRSGPSGSYVAAATLRCEN